MSNPACSFDDPRIEVACSVNDVLLRHPETVAVFNAFGIDSCCRGDASLHEAAHDAGLLPETLLFALKSVVRHDAETPRREGAR